MESAETAHRRAALNLAIIGVLADDGIRRSEAAPLTWCDVELWADGSGRLKMQKGKNQVEPATSQALREIQPEYAAFANRVRAAARAAGLGDGFTGRSGRIGMARGWLLLKRPTPRCRARADGSVVTGYTPEAKPQENH